MNIGQQKQEEQKAIDLVERQMLLPAHSRQWVATIVAARKEAREEGRQEILACTACLPGDPCKNHSGR